MDARKAALDTQPDGLGADEARRVARFHALIQEGLEELDRGEGVEVTDVKAWTSA